MGATKNGAREGDPALITSMRHLRRLTPGFNMQNLVIPLADIYPIITSYLYVR